MLRGFGAAERVRCDLPRHLLTGEELSAAELHALLDRALALKATPLRPPAPLEGRTVALLFEHPSTRTRTSMEAGVFELGGHPMVLRAERAAAHAAASRSATRRCVFSRHAARDRAAHRAARQRLRELAELRRRCRW